MSSNKTTMAGFAAMPKRGPGAEYGKPERPVYDTDETDVCLGCGGSIPPEVARVAGDNQGCVPGCRSCVVSSKDGKGFDTHARAALNALWGNTERKPEVRR